MTFSGKPRGGSETKKKKYSVLLLDADGTVLDYKKADRYAFSRFMQDMEAADSEEAYELFCRINRRHWTDYELGKTGRDELPAKIYGDFFSAAALKSRDFKEADRIFLTYLAQAGFVFRGAREFVKAASAVASVIVVSNGSDEVQRSRLRCAGLMPYLSGVYTSSQIGCPKPKPAFFSYVFSDRPELKKEETILLGDSTASDMNGAANAGIAACLLDLKGTVPRQECAFPVVSSYSEFFDRYLAHGENDGKSGIGPSGAG